MTRRPSVDTISTYLSQGGGSDYRFNFIISTFCIVIILICRYGYASQNGSHYGGSLGSQELVDMYEDEDSVFTDDSYGDGQSTYRYNVLCYKMQYSAIQYIAVQYWEM